MTSHNGKENMKQNGRLIFYHRTTAENARSIMENGFMNSAGYFLGNRTWTGVRLSARPLAADDCTDGDVTLMIKLDMAEHQLARWEWTKEGRTYREWVIPAPLVNSCMTVEMVDELDLSPVAA